MKRRVTGIINHLQDIPWQGAKIDFSLRQGSYNQFGFYPEDKISMITNESGFFAVDLWCNADGITPSFYDCVINNKESFSFTLAAGTGDIDLSVLKSTGTQVFPTPVVPKQNDIREIFIPTSGQINFPLRFIPTQPQKSRVWFNGLKLLYAVDYLIDSSILKYLLLTPRLEDTDVVEIYYFIEINNA